MKIPEFHLIDTTLETCHTLCLHLPSPFEENTILKAHIHLYPQPHGRVYVEFWGVLPRLGFELPENQAKFSDGYITYPSNNKEENYREFIENMIQIVTKCPIFQNGVQRMLTLHRNAIQDAKCHENDS